MFNKNTFEKVTKIFAYAFVAYETLKFAMEKLEQVNNDTYKLEAVKNED